MLKDVPVELVTDLMEVVHVELPHERGKVAVAEIGRQNLLLKDLDLQNGETSALRVPSDDVVVLTALNE
jgi:hypothetical protein